MKRYSNNRYSALTAVETFCVTSCCHGSKDAVVFCPKKQCPLWHFRLSTSPDEVNLPQKVVFYQLTPVEKINVHAPEVEEELKAEQISLTNTTEKEEKPKADNKDSNGGMNSKKQNSQNDSDFKRRRFTWKA